MLVVHIEVRQQPQWLLLPYLNEDLQYACWHLYWHCMPIGSQTNSWLLWLTPLVMASTGEWARCGALLAVSTICLASR